MSERPDNQRPPDLQLDYGHAPSPFDKPRTSIAWFLLGFALPIIPIVIIGDDLYDFSSIIYARDLGYAPPHDRDYHIFAFFTVIVLAAMIGLVRVRKAQRPVRYLLVGFMTSLGVMSLLEGLCFGMK